ncbi:MAG: hypothetical protein V4693_14260 [Pseudomonadota bacterium]
MHPVIEAFLTALKSVASSPLGMIGFIILVAAWVVVVIHNSRVRELDRLTLPPGISGAQHLRKEKQRFLLYGYLATIIAILIFLLAAKDALLPIQSQLQPQLQPQRPLAEPPVGATFEYLMRYKEQQDQIRDARVRKIGRIDGKTLDCMQIQNLFNDMLMPDAPNYSAPPENTNTALLEVLRNGIIERDRAYSRRVDTYLDMAYQKSCLHR